MEESEGEGVKMQVPLWGVGGSRIKAFNAQTFLNHQISLIDSGMVNLPGIGGMSRSQFDEIIIHP